MKTFIKHRDMLNNWYVKIWNTKEYYDYEREKCRQRLRRTSHKSAEDIATDQQLYVTLSQRKKDAIEQEREYKNVKADCLRTLKIVIYSGDHRRRNAVMRSFCFTYLMAKFVQDEMAASLAKEMTRALRHVPKKQYFNICKYWFEKVHSDKVFDFLPEDLAIKIKLIIEMSRQ